MNREIKFKAWDKIYKKMREVSRIIWSTPIKDEGNIHAYYNDGRNEEYNPKEYFIMEKDMVLLQFTGVKDFDENEIFEGDLLQDDVREKMGLQPLFVEFKEGSFWLNDGISFIYLTRINLKGLRVVGNIYDKEV